MGSISVRPVRHDIPSCCGYAGEGDAQCMPCFYQRRRDNYNQIPELQVCVAEALYDIESVLTDPNVFNAQELMRLRDQIVNNLERAWEITGRGEDELASMMVQIS